MVIIVQENRSFDNIFAGFPGADAPSYGYLHTGQRVPLSGATFDDTGNLPHSFSSALDDWNGGAMNGYDLTSYGSGNAPRLPYAHLRKSLVEPYWDMASTYTLADRMFATEWGGSFTAHLDLIAGTALLSPGEAEADFPTAMPWGCDAPAGTTTTLVDASYQMSIGPFPCFRQFRTMADTLDDASVSWAYYAPPIRTEAGSIWSIFDAIRRVRMGEDWRKHVLTPETAVLRDAAAGRLPAVSWVVPDERNSDHEGSDSDTGPSWVAAVVNAVGESKNWDSTAIFVVWDDWGGWYDDAVPPRLDYAGLGLRVPCIVISPFAKAHYVSHTQYEFGSILKFVEETFALPPLGYTDVRARSMSDAFDFAAAPRAFRPVETKYPAATFAHERSSLKVPDDD